jgi:hypothetical protein
MSSRTPWYAKGMTRPRWDAGAEIGSVGDKVVEQAEDVAAIGAAGVAVMP